jgi:serine/threonine protein kinase
MRAGGEIDGWRLIERLGRGGNAEVWEAERSDVGPVALKVLRVRNRSAERFLRFRREVETLRSLGPRPGILPIVDARLPEARNEPAWLAMPKAVTA